MLQRVWCGVSWSKSESHCADKRLQRQTAGENRLSNDAAGHTGGRRGACKFDDVEAVVPQLVDEIEVEMVLPLVLPVREVSCKLREARVPTIPVKLVHGLVRMAVILHVLPSIPVRHDALPQLCTLLVPLRRLSPHRSNIWLHRRRDGSDLHLLRPFRAVERSESPFQTCVIAYEQLRCHVRHPRKVSDSLGGCDLAHKSRYRTLSGAVGCRAFRWIPRMQLHAPLRSLVLDRQHEEQLVSTVPVVAARQCLQCELASRARRVGLRQRAQNQAHTAGQHVPVAVALRLEQPCVRRGRPVNERGGVLDKKQGSARPEDTVVRTTNGRRRAHDPVVRGYGRLSHDGPRNVRMPERGAQLQPPAQPLRRLQRPSQRHCLRNVGDLAADIDSKREPREPRTLQTQRVADDHLLGLRSSDHDCRRLRLEEPCEREARWQLCPCGPQRPDSIPDAVGTLAQASSSPTRV